MMNNFRVPPSPTWYIPPVCSPENGLLYIAGNHTSIAYIPPVQTNDDASNCNENASDSNIQNVQIIQTHNHFKSIACDPNWSSSKLFVTMNEQNAIWVWDLETGKTCRGHKAHVLNVNDNSNGDSQIGGTMCISKNRQVLSIDRNAFVRYCIASNTYSIFPDNFVVKRGTVSILKTSPYNQDIIAVGYKNGLIVIVNYAETTILQTLRGHDSEIVSLQWTFIEDKPQNEMEKMNGTELTEVQDAQSTHKTERSKSKFNKPTEKKQTNREPPKPIVDAGDMFDIHSFDYLEEEFGTISNRISTETVDDAPEDYKVNTNERFNFAEECQSLRDQIKAGNDSDSDESYGYNGTNQSAVNMSDIQTFLDKNGPILDDSIAVSDCSDGPVEVDELSNLSTIGSSHNTTEIVELEEVIRECVSEETIKSNKGTIYLASGAQETNVVVWNAQTGTISDKIQLRTDKGRTKIPKPNCTIAWINANTFVVNGPDGRLSMWKPSESTKNKKMKFTFVHSDYSDVAVINICSNVQYKPINPIVWTFSTHMNIIGHSFTCESSKIISKYSTLPIGMFALRVCPHDPNKIAIAGNNKRINILDLSTLNNNNIEIQSLTSKIQGKVIALSWHPTNENLLSFSTIEGRVGIFNINKATSAPDLMKNFNGKDLYGLSYSVDSDSKKCTLFVTNHQKLMMFNENSIKQDDHNALEFEHAISTVSSNDLYIAIGFSNGTLKILLKDKQYTEVFTEIISKKYLSEVSWSSIDATKLAVSSNDHNIYILSGNEHGFKKIGELIGHHAGVTCVNWSSQSEHRLVSASFDHTVRVWDTDKSECIALSEYENKMNCATFLPTDENFIVCSGQSETMHIFEIKKRLVANIGPFDSKKKKKPFNSDIQYGTKYQNESSKLQAQEKKRLKQLEKKVTTDNVSKLADELADVKLAAASVKLNHITILHLTNKEINKNPLDHLQRLLQQSNDKTNQMAGEFFHGKLFGDREDVQQLLNDELKNHQLSKTNSIGNLIIPQIKFELTANIIESIKGKCLTEQQVSLAPSISFEFWKNCSLAFAHQCIEQGFVLQALPHLLATHQIDDAIDNLCNAHFYREAWCVAKMSKEPEDAAIFETIVTKWIAHLERLGNLEGAALISFLADKHDLSFDILNKRKFKTPQIEDILNVLSETVTNKSI